ILLLDASGPVATSAYQAAIDAGAGVIVGPLLKQAVAEIAAIAGPVTTLALNFLEPGAPTAPNFYQYSLAPEDEARQAAARAAAEGQSRALALAPDNEWGRRMLGAFIPAVEAQGGTVADYYLYDTAETDFTAPIQRLLRLDESRARHRELAANLGVSLGFEPRRRDDVDFIFLAANVAHGRLIWPQLRFLYAGDLPTYAPSAINQPGARGNSDLDGVRFADAPLLLGTESQGVALAGTLATRWPANTVGLLRFYAMGFDAYALARDIAEGITPERPGLTGRLWTDPQRRVHRDMPWAQFRDGGIVLLPSTATTPAASP
ncbi:MAG: penicillin-binding protein activator, partial [Gammaproteobacteria bacterium]|nr:penicillin-binding protein activator [Gammaproteobacteria bacterium]